MFRVFSLWCCTPDKCDGEISPKTNVADFHVPVDRIDMDCLAIAEVNAYVAGATPVEGVVADDIPGQEFIQVYIPEDDIDRFAPVGIFTGGTRARIALLGEDRLDKQRAVKIPLSHAGIRVGTIGDALTPNAGGTPVLQGFDDGRVVEAEAAKCGDLISGFCVERESKRDDEG